MSSSAKRPTALTIFARQQPPLQPVSLNKAPPLTSMIRIRCFRQWPNYCIEVLGWSAKRSLLANHLHRLKLMATKEQPEGGGMYYIGVKSTSPRLRKIRMRYSNAIFLIRRLLTVIKIRFAANTVLRMVLCQNVCL
jgi:hypothetical protein